LELTPDFIGSSPGEPSKNAKELADWLGNRRILFPVSEISKGSLTEFIPSSQAETVLVYSTKPAPVTIAQQDVYIFSSPSNVDSFLLQNPTPTGVIVAWGKSTKRSLKEHSIFPSVTLLRSEESELISHLSAFL
jgi:uroporphyrinogen-III synthase